MSDPLLGSIGTFLKGGSSPDGVRCIEVSLPSSRQSHFLLRVIRRNATRRLEFLSIIMSFLGARIG